jgi:hypothetical protein
MKRIPTAGLTHSFHLKIAPGRISFFEVSKSFSGLFVDEKCYSINFPCIDPGYIPQNLIAD